MLLVRPPYHLSALTQAAALAAIELRAELARDIESIRSARVDLVKELTQLGLKVYPSEANFLLFTGFAGTAHDLWQKLTTYGVLIRDVGIKDHLRVTVGTRAENRAFIDAMTELVRG